MATMPSEYAAEVLGQTQLVEPGYGSPGFRKSERRETWGGSFWRRSDPTQPSKAFGSDYETWESIDGGPVARWMADNLDPSVVRATRLDVAFDFAVDEDFTACELEGLYGPHRDAHGLTPGISGEGRWVTHYVGSSTSPLRTRIYRRDGKHPELVLDGLPHILRLEVVHKKGSKSRNPAFDLHRLYSSSKVDAYAKAAAVLLRHTGIRVQDDIRDVPVPAEKSPEVELAQLVLTFVRQNARTVLRAKRAGIDITELCEAASDNWSRHTKWRFDRDSGRDSRLDFDHIKQLLREGRDDQA